jgi:hypothetical protein
MWGGRPRLAKPVKRRPTRASTAVQGDRPTLDLVKKLWKQDTSVLSAPASGADFSLPRPLRAAHQLKLEDLAY